MACSLNLEYCTRGGGCSNCPHNINEGRKYLDIDWQKECERADMVEKENIRMRQESFISSVLPQCLVPLLNVDGVGFFIDNHFVTCGHCLEEGDGIVKISYEGKLITFHAEDAIIYDVIDPQSEEEPDGDIAIFAFKGVKSFLKVGVDPFESQLSSSNQNLLIASIEHKCEEPYEVGGNSHLLVSSIEKYELTISEANDMNLLDFDKENPFGSKFFEVKTEKTFGPGVSGSPIFDENYEVLGLLVGCRNPQSAPNTILFHSLAWHGYSLGLSNPFGMNDPY